MTAACLRIGMNVNGLRLEAIVALDPRRFYPVCTDGKHTAPPEDRGVAWAYMQMVDRHHVPLEAMAVVARTLDRLLEADDHTTMRQIIGDAETFRKAVAQLDMYMQFQPTHFDRDR
jgi:Plasmid pRiA4b ORF-3-like protein